MRLSFLALLAITFCSFPCEADSNRIHDCQFSSRKWYTGEYFILFKYSILIPLCLFPEAQEVNFLTRYSAKHLTLSSAANNFLYWVKDGTNTINALPLLL